MKIKVILPGSIRSKKNSKRIYGYGKYKKVLPSKAYLEWEEAARYYMTVNLFPANIGTYINLPVSVNMQAYYKGPRPDLSGAEESVGDCLEGYLWENDKQIISWDGSRLHHDLKNPRTEITVEYKELKDANPTIKA